MLSGVETRRDHVVAQLLDEPQVEHLAMRRREVGHRSPREGVLVGSDDDGLGLQLGRLQLGHSRPRLNRHPRPRTGLVVHEVAHDTEEVGLGLGGVLERGVRCERAHDGRLREILGVGVAAGERAGEPEDVDPVLDHELTEVDDLVVVILLRALWVGRVRIVGCAAPHGPAPFVPRVPACRTRPNCPEKRRYRTFVSAAAQRLQVRGSTTFRVLARVLVTRRLPEGGLDPLLAAEHEVVEAPGDVPLTEPELVAALADVDAVVCVLTDRMHEGVLRSARDRLRVVANVAVGYDNIDVRAAAELGIAVCNTPGVLDETTADLAFFLVLAASRRTSDAEADLRNGRWTGFHVDAFLGVDVHRRTLGVVGFGRIGRAVARRAEGFGMEVFHHTRHDTGLPGWVGDLDDLLPRSDAVTLHVPLSDETRHLIDARRLALMHRDAVLVNTARGPIVDEEALAVALEDGTIFGAGIDVYEHEPTVHPRLLAAPHAVLLPHIGSASAATRVQMARLACDGVVAVLAGGRPPNLVVPATRTGE